MALNTPNVFFVEGKVKHCQYLGREFNHGHCLNDCFPGMALECIVGGLIFLLGPLTTYLFSLAS